MQMILKTLCSFLALLLELFGVYGDGEFKYPYIAVVISFSQMWALYCLVQFYIMTYHWLEPIHPLAKFISFKAIGIAMICYFGVLPKEVKIQNSIQDFLICIELTKPYQFMSVSLCGKATSMQTIAQANLEDKEKKPTVVEQKKACFEALGTSITESVQDVVIGGGEHEDGEAKIEVEEHAMKNVKDDETKLVSSAEIVTENRD
ncbi:hypothetical protein IEQ34_017890 [Dendrobium chrysotoxum]|uniref:Uncharacterized protein n=1 Tax=Dendrobium chrysotoxum TaxID=161865 RepID=A0AAV7GAX6_DENCH|nr:hypothetical protein IEQ34_017890 [Dendrobium chrysotoxum]